MKLIPLPQFFAFWSARLALAQTGVITLWAAYPWPSPTVDLYAKWAVFLLNVGIVISRIVKQQPISPGDLQQLPPK